MMNDEDWEKETTKRWNAVANLFKPKENLVIADFIQTAKKSS